jgi:F-type H+-transporting ATPase subunit b
MLHDPTFWVAIAFLGFVALLVYFKVPKMISGALDSRAEKIKSDLDEAEELLKEAQDLLATYQKKQRDAADEAKQIRASAEDEAGRIAQHGEERLVAALERREKLALERIGQAEAAALDLVRARTVDIALEATREILATKVSADKADAMLDDAIKELPNRLN